MIEISSSVKQVGFGAEKKEGTPAAKLHADVFRVAYSNWNPWTDLTTMLNNRYARGTVVEKYLESDLRNCSKRKKIVHKLYFKISPNLQFIRFRIKFQFEIKDFSSFTPN